MREGENRMSEEQGEMGRMGRRVRMGKKSKGLTKDKQRTYKDK